MLEKLLGSRLRAKVLGWLFTHPDERFFVRQLTGILGVDSTNLSRELARLRDMGVLISEEEGREKYYRANPKCAIHEELHGIARKTTGTGDVLREALLPLADRIRVAFVFGSLAKGTETAASDIDVMVVGDVEFGEVVSALSPAQDTLRREINPSVCSRGEFQEKAGSGHHFITTLVREPKIFLIGSEDELGELAKE